MGTILGATREEKEVLDRVLDRTGLTFSRVAGMPTDRKDVAERVLPVLADCFVSSADPGLRAAICWRFEHPSTGYPFLERIIGWWDLETDSLVRGYLTQLIARLMKDRDGVRIWKKCRARNPDEYQVLLLARLARTTSVGRCVRDYLADTLRERPGELDLGFLEVVSTVDDPRIRDWFASLDHSDEKVRHLAERVATRSLRLPSGFEFENAGPDSSNEIASTELDSTRLQEWLRDTAKRNGVRFPRQVDSGRFLNLMNRDQWVSVPVLEARRTAYRLWFRLEDWDTVEVVFSREAAARKLSIQ